MAKAPVTSYTKKKEKQIVKLRHNRREYTFSSIKELLHLILS